MRYALGVDMGGTKILVGIIDLKSGEVVATAKRKTQAKQGPDELLGRLNEAVEDVVEAAKGTPPEAIGVGAAGQIDRQHGILLSGPNLGQHMDNLPLGPVLSERFKLPVVVGNDVQVAAIGEHRFGAGQGYNEFLCVFVGTGIGGSIVRDGAIYRGATATAGEIGHLVVDLGGRLCGCGGRGHLEAYASRSAIVRAILGELRGGRQSSLESVVAPRSADLPGGTAIRSKALARAVADGDSLAVEAVMEAARYLSAGLASVINFYNPPRIVLGGGFIDAVDLFFTQVERDTRTAALQTPRHSVEIVRAALGDNAGIVGAAVMAASAA